MIAGTFITLSIISFWINGVHSIKDIFTNKTALENTYFFMQILCSFVVMVGGIIGVWQYSLAKKTEAAQYHNNRIQKAIDLSGYYKDNILCYITCICHVYRTSGILDILDNVKREEMNDFDIQELEKNFNPTQRKQLRKILHSDRFLEIIIESAEIFSKDSVLADPIFIKDGEKMIEARKINQNKVIEYFKNDIVCAALNNLEYFALHFNYETADRLVVYQSLHKTYLDIVQMLYYDISINNETGEQKLYTNVIRLISNPHFKWGSNVSPSRALPWFRLRRGFAVPFLLAASSGRPCYFLPSSILSFSSCSLM